MSLDVRVDAMQQPVDLSDAKYGCIEYERRFVVRPTGEWRALVQPYSKRFEDTYLAGTRLRLRVQTDSDTGRRVHKLNRKFDSPSPYFRVVNRVLLTAGEHEILDRLEGSRLSKIRHYHLWNDRVFSVDVFEGHLDGLVTCETEAAELSDLMAVVFPAYAVREVTEDPFFSGDSLSRVTRAHLQRVLGEMGCR